MTEFEIQRGSARLDELKRRQALPPETLQQLSRWWCKTLRREQNKVVSIDEWKRKRSWFV